MDTTAPAATPLSALAPVRLFSEAPVAIREVKDDLDLDLKAALSGSVTRRITQVDFGRVAFGNLHLLLTPDLAGKVVRIHFGEAFDPKAGPDENTGRINRTPPGSVRYACATFTVPASVADEINAGKEWRVIAPPADTRNTGPAAVPLPAEWGVLLPFRWVEIEVEAEAVSDDRAQSSPQQLQSPSLLISAENVRRRAAYSANWDDNASSFHCNDELLGKIWELCRYSIKATTFAGVYVDGDRERIPYEADAYVNQISHYACDPGPQFARATFDWLMRAPTWPTEWAAHMIFMAHADWMFTGHTDWIAARFDALKAKLLPARQRPDGLLGSSPEEQKLDLVDWPPGERDGYEFTSANTVVNAFQYRALVLMSELADALSRPDEASRYRAQAATLASAYQKAFYRPEATVSLDESSYAPASTASLQGLYADGGGSDHISLHANLFSLAFGLIPADRRATVIAYIKSRRMACSVYPAQYLLEALFEAGEADYALALIIAPGNRSWRHMQESGTTITWEAWDQIYKPNQDWNHAWGAAPANILPRYVLGVRPLSPGYTRVTVRPQLGFLKNARGTVPTIHGPIHVSVSRNKHTGEITTEVTAPPNVEIVR